jgi:hypothetical protein
VRPTALFPQTSPDLLHYDPSDHALSPSSSEESEKNLRNLVEDEALDCAILIK